MGALLYKNRSTIWVTRLMPTYCTNQESSSSWRSTVFNDPPLIMQWVTDGDGDTFLNNIQGYALCNPWTLTLNSVRNITQTCATGTELEQVSADPAFDNICFYCFGTVQRWWNCTNKTYTNYCFEPNWGYCIMRKQMHISHNYKMYK